MSAQASTGRPLRIFQVVEPYLPTVTGVTLAVRRHVVGLANRGHDVVLAAPAFAGHEGDVRDGGVRTVRFPAVGWPTYDAFRVCLPSVRRAVRLLEAVRPDVVHLQAFGALALVTARWALRRRVPLVVTYHTYLPDIFGYLSPAKLPALAPLVRLAEASLPARAPEAPPTTRRTLSASIGRLVATAFTRRFFDQASVVLAPSEAIRRELVSCRVRVPVEVVSSGFGFDPFGREALAGAGFDRGRPRLLHLGRLGFEKRVDVVVQAMKHVVATLPRATLTIAGDGPARPSLERLVTRLALDEHVRFLGQVAHEDTPAIYRSHDVFVTASPMETQGIVLLEAMASGLPIVACDALAIPELVVPEETGLLAAANDPVGLARAVTSLLETPERMARMGRVARERARAHDAPRVIDRLEQVYAAVLVPGRRQHPLAVG